MFVRKTIYASLAAMMLVGPALYGQQTGTGTITGVVTDPSGGLVPRVTVVARDVQTGVKTSTETRSNGIYTIPFLRTGQYELTAEAYGFRTYVRPGITLSVDTTVTIDIRLALGTATQKVVVKAGAPLLQASTSDLGMVMDNLAYTNLPLPVSGARMDPTAFMLLAPGVTGSTYEAQVNGGQSFTDEIWMGGVPAGLGELQASTRPALFGSSVDAIQEFKMTTNNYTADMGRAGGILDLEYKSGTNQLHGDAYEFLRNEAFDARGFFAPRTPRDREDEFGFSLGGPVYVPGVYNGHDRTFFFFNYDGYRDWPGSSGFRVTLPTAAERAGDFSGIANVYDPTTIATLPDGTLTKTEFPNDTIPADRISPISAKFLTYLPMPDSAGLVNNYIGQLPGIPETSEDSYTMRVDHTFSTKQNLTFTWGFGPQTSPLASGNPNGILGPLGAYRSYGGYEHVIRLSDTYSIAPNLVNRISIGYNRDATLFKDPDQGTQWPTLLGLKGLIPDNTMPDIEFENGGFASWHPNAYTGSALNDTYNEDLEDMLNWFHGKHNFKFGVDIRHSNYVLNVSSLPGQFFFSSTETGIPSLPDSGNSFASFMIGATDEDLQVIQAAGTTSDEWTYMAYYAQDDYKVTPKLTLNLGLRYEIPFPATEAHNKQSGFDPTLPNPGAGNLPGAMIFAGSGPDSCDCSRLTNTAFTEFGPRFGLAYALNAKTVLRGGYGIFYTPGGNIGGNDIGGQPFGWEGVPILVSPNAGITPAYYWDNPFPLPAGFELPPNFTPTVENGGYIYWYIKNEGEAPDMQNWNIDLQRQITPNLMVSAAYVGSKGTRLPTSLFNPNQVNSKYLSLGNLLGDDINSPQAQAAIASGEIPPAPYAGFQGTVADSLLPYPQYIGGGVVPINDMEGNSSYNAFQLEVQKRFSYGLTLQLSYTGAKNLSDSGAAGAIAGGGAGSRDSYDRSIQKGLAPTDIPEDLEFSYVYRLPFGPQQRFLRKGGAFGKLVGGWQISGIQTYYSGLPMSMVVNDTLDIFNDYNAPNIVRGVSPRSNIPLSSFNVFAGQSYVNLNAFSQPAPFTIGNAPVTMGNLRTPFYYNEDIGIAKRTAIGERFNIEFRADAFNPFNRVVYAVPQSDNFSSPSTVGVIGSQDNSPRSLQLSLRISF